jgi:flagellin
MLFVFPLLGANFNKLRRVLSGLFFSANYLFLVKTFGGNMALIINTNLGSINGQRNLNGSTSAQATAMTRLSSGIRVNNAKDDAAGLAIADRMTSQIRGMTVATRNANDGISLTQTAEGALGSLTDTLQRMRDLAIQSSSTAGVSASDRSKMQTEFKALNEELLRVVQNSEFNGKKILNGDLAGGLNIQVGASTDTNSRISVAVSNMTTLLTPVTKSTLAPTDTPPIDSTLASTVAISASTASADTQLTDANNAAKLANAAVEAAKLAAASPNDVSLARAASAANLAAATALSGSSTNILGTTTTNRGSNIVSEAFLNQVTAENGASIAAVGAITTTDANIQAAAVTDARQAASLLTTATELAASAARDISAAGQNAYANTMFSLTGDTLDIVDSRTTNAVNVLNDSVARSVMGSFGADRQAQKILASENIANAIAAASYVNDPLKTAAANETDKQSFINNNKLVIETKLSVDGVSTAYALSAVDSIDDAIAFIDTERSNLGSTQNRFTTTIANLQNGIENQSAAKSRIMDADFAQETAALSRAQILQQAGTAMLAQANQAGQTVMTLLR